MSAQNVSHIGTYSQENVSWIAVDIKNHWRETDRRNGTDIQSPTTVFSPSSIYKYYYAEFSCWFWCQIAGLLLLLFPVILHHQLIKHEKRFMLIMYENGLVYMFPCKCHQDLSAYLRNKLRITRKTILHTQAPQNTMDPPSKQTRIYLFKRRICCLSLQIKEGKRHMWNSKDVRINQVL